MARISGLTTAQVATRTGLDASNVLKHAKRREFPGARKRTLPSGRREWRFPIAGVHAFNARRRKAKAR